MIAIDGSIIKGTMPKSVLKNVFRWMEEHHDELLENWRRMQDGEEIIKIEPFAPDFLYCNGREAA
ncbi:MAG: DUF4160 domain-containing protein [Bacteroidales bacterium]|nr:DUF4160 domain-containing protein [Candidatus Physcousia equi]